MLGETMPIALLLRVERLASKGEAERSVKGVGGGAWGEEYEVNLGMPDMVVRCILDMALKILR